MSTRFYFGLNTERSLSELENKGEALVNLNLNKLDLDVLYGLRDLGTSANDIKTISSLNVDFQKELYSIQKSAQELTFVFRDVNTIETGIFSDIQLNGKYSAKSFKYNYLDFADSNIKGADVSTSRVSSWSTFEEPPVANTPIFYGGTVEVEPVANSSIIDFENIEVLTQLEERRFSGETPTHLVTLNVNGNDEKFYAMKSIPLRFKGQFKNATLKLRFYSFDENVRPSIVIKNLNRNTEFVDAEKEYDYELNYFDSVPAPREIEIYYPANQIDQIDLQRMNISQIPNEVLDKLRLLRLHFNIIKKIPNFSVLTPILEVLDLIRNDLSEDSKENLENLPTTLRVLNLREAIRINQELDFSYLNNLETFVFYENRSEANIAPLIDGSSLKHYDIRRNFFETIPNEVLTSTTLERLYIRSNRISANNITIDSPNLISFITGRNEHNIVNVSGKTNLEFYVDSNRSNINGNNSLDGIFNGCTSLETISLWRNYEATGNLETLLSDQGLTNLSIFDARYTNIYGKLANDSLKGCVNFRNLYLQESRIGLDEFGNRFDNFFDENCFSETDLRELYIVTNSNVVGNLPDFSQNENLFRIRLLNLGLTGGLRSFRNNSNFRRLQVRNCQLNQRIPNFQAINLERIYLDRNNLYGSIPQFDLPNLNIFVAYNNNLTGKIPSFINCPELFTLNLDNNNLDDYEIGAFESNFKLKNISLQNNNLSTTSIENIIEDLYLSYTTLPRSGVTVDLRGNISSDAFLNLSQETLNNIEFLNGNGWRITT